MSELSESAQVTGLIARHPLPLAGLLAIATLPVHLVLPQVVSVMLAGGILAMVSGIYVGFALLDGRNSPIVRECAVAVVFTVYSALCVLFAPMLLPLGYIAHGLWDASHHRHGLALRMPLGYVPFCAFYDVLAALGLWWIWSL